MIKLEDFVAETLKQIIMGVKAAQEYAAENGAKVSPANLCLSHCAQGDVRLMEENTCRIAQEIDFDIAVTTTEGTETKGGVGIFVGPVALGTQGKSDAQNSSISRIKFQVPILLPNQQ